MKQTNKSTRSWVCQKTRINKQVGSHFVKDALGNFVMDPLKDSAVQAALQTTGMQGAAQTAGHTLDEGVVFVNKMRTLYNMFYN